MTDVIDQYQKWKLQGEDLRAKAKLAMESRFRDLLLEAVKVAEEYKTDFGGVLKPPPVIVTFRYKAGKARKQVSASNTRGSGSAAPNAGSVTPRSAATPTKAAASATRNVAVPTSKKADAPVISEKKPLPPPATDRKFLGLQKRLATAKKKLESAKAAGAPTRDLDDKVYELEDALRVAQSAD